jgi:acyl-coenzyme A thioesterase PaaI-like protein
MLLRETLNVWAWSFVKVPLLFAVRPVVMVSDEQRVVARIGLRRKTKNHLGSMYFGALCIGADVAGGLAAMRAIERSGGGVSLIFKDVQARFLKRPEGDVFFTCRDGEALRELVAVARASGAREEMTVRVVATVPSISGDEPVAEFSLTISIKQKAPS